MSMDKFFFHGQNDLLDEIEEEIKLVAIQPKRSLFYDRDYGAGVTMRENVPNTFSQHISLRYDLVSAIALMNSRVSDGTDGLPDRRAAVSQGSISVSKEEDEEMNVQILYIPLTDAKNYGTVELPMGVQQ